MIYGDNPEPEKQGVTATLEPPAEGQNISPSASHAEVSVEEKIPEKSSDRKIDSGAVAAKINDVKNKLNEVRAAAVARGEPPPSIVGQEALDVDATSLHSDKDLGDLVFNVSNVEQSVAGEAGKQMLQTGGQLAGAAVGFSMAGNLSNLPASLSGLSGLIMAESLHAKKVGIGNMQGASETADYSGIMDPDIKSRGKEFEMAMKAESAKAAAEGRVRSKNDDQK